VLYKGDSLQLTICGFYLLEMELNVGLDASFDNICDWKEIRELKVKVKVMLRPTVQSASLSWCQAPIWGLRPYFHCCHTVAGLLMWSALSDEGTGLPFRIAAGPLGSE
jgi:hypothetical protein